MRFVVVFFFISVVSKAQQDSAIGVPLFGVYFGGQIPSGIMHERFGPNLQAGANFMYKTNKNWIWGIQSNYMFGNGVKEDVLANLETPEGFVIDNEGYPANIRVSERGIGIYLTIGKILPVFNTNANSGLMVNFGVGYLQHKIHLYDVNKKVAAIKDNLVFGYDHLTAGPSICQFIGYLYMGDNRMSNFYFGIEFTEAYTKSLRKLHYNTGKTDTETRIDVLSGIRVGWILPLYKKRPSEFYYN